MTNFITPPDFVDNANTDILIIDASPTDVESVVVLLSGHPKSFNVYLFNEDMTDRVWLDQAVDIADVIIVNTVTTTLSSFKARLLALPKTLNYDSLKGFDLALFDYTTNNDPQMQLL